VHSTALPPLRCKQLKHLHGFYQAAQTVSEPDVSILFPHCDTRRARASPTLDARRQRSLRVHAGGVVQPEYDVTTESRVRIGPWGMPSIGSAAFPQDAPRARCHE
jgi:hypothetical protein